MRDEDAFGQDVTQRQRDVFRMFVGQGRRVSYAALSEATGIPVSTLKSYAGDVSIPLPNLLRLAKTLPRAAANMLIEPSGFCFMPASGSHPDWLLIGELAGEFAARVMRYQRSDNLIDHQEDADLRTFLRQMFADGAEALAQRD